MSTASPTTPPFDAVYYGTFSVVVIAVLILLLLCCGCVSRAQNNAAASAAQDKLLRARLVEVEKNGTAEEAGELLSQIEKANQGGLLTDFADSFVVPASSNEVSEQIGLFFYHSSVGRLALLSVEQLIQKINWILTIVFSGLVINYINTYIVPTFVNAAHGSFTLCVGLLVAIVVLEIFSRQYSGFLLPRLGGTGMVEHAKTA
jgi:outer membrane murein-binding lipoprotein Lpp